MHGVLTGLARLAKRGSKRAPRPLPHPGITTRGRDSECGNGLNCAPTCRNGQPWPTLRQNPEDDP
jgi:hypothetical protein